MRVTPGRWDQFEPEIALFTVLFGDQIILNVIIIDYLYWNLIGSQKYPCKNAVIPRICKDHCIQLLGFESLGRLGLK